MVYTSDPGGPRRPTSGRTGVGSSSFASPGRDGAGVISYVGVNQSGRGGIVVGGGGPVKPKEFKFSFEDGGGQAPMGSKPRPSSAGIVRAQVRERDHHRKLRAPFDL
jgi:hypothetical protein